MDLLAPGSLLGAIGWKVLPRIELGPLSVSPHGIGIAVGYALGGVLLARRAARIGISRDDVWNMLMWAVVGVIVGARLFYVFGHIDEYASEPLQVFNLRAGGIVFYGGAIGGILAALPYMRRHGLPFWPLADAAAPGFPLGLIFGRIGDLVIGDHLGGPTDMPWGFKYVGGIGCEPEQCLPDRVLPIGAVVHQTALYDFVNALVLFPVVLLLARKRRPPGWLFGFMIIWYAAGRFVTDFARTAPTYLGLRGTQWVSVAIILFGAVVLARLARGGSRGALAAAGANGETEGPASEEQSRDEEQPREEPQRD